MFIAGHELSTSDALQEAGELAEVLGAAVYQQTVTVRRAFPVRASGVPRPADTQSAAGARLALQPYDLLVFLGADRAAHVGVQPVDPLPDGARVVQIGERDWELAKNYPAEIALKADVKETLRALLPVLRGRRQPSGRPRRRAGWPN